MEIRPARERETKACDISLALSARLSFVGTGEAFDPDLPNTSLLYRGDRSVLCDCGYSVPHAFWRISRDPSLLDAVYVTHVHADHSFGLPALLGWMREEGRTRPLSVIGGSGVGGWLDGLRELAYPGSAGKGFAVEARELDPGASFELGALVLSNAPSRHSVRNLALRIDEAGRSFAYSGDGAPSDATRRLFRGVNVLVHECYADSAGPSNHATAEELIPMAADLGVERLCLLHHGRNQKAAIRARAARCPTLRPDSGQVLIPQPGDELAI